LNDVLYDVTSPISVGDAIVVGTNITAANKISANIQTLTNNVSGIYDVIGKTGSKNWLKLTDVITGADITTITDEGANINVKKATAASWARFAVKIDVQPNTDYIMSTHIDYVSGRARVAVRNADDSANIFESADIQSDSDFSRQFNTGANSQVVVRLFCTANTVETGEVNFENAMIRLATDADATFQPYAKTNQQLTEDTASLLDNTEVNGAVNYIYPINPTNTDSSGVTWTLNSDNSISVSSGGIAPSTGTGFSYRNNNAAFLRGKTVTFKANVTGNTPTYDKLYFAVICRETESGANLVRYDLWPIVGQTEVTFTIPNNTNYVLIGCNIQNGATTAIDCKISPIVSLASYNGDYVPYAKSNKELTDDVADARILIGSVTQHLSVIADGTKTIQTLMQELHSALSSLVASLNTDEVIYILGARSDGGTWFRPSNVELKYSKSSTVGNISMDSFTVTAGENCYHYSLTFSSTLATNTFRQMTVAQSGNTFVNRTSDVPSANSQLLLTYQIYKTIS
jgi:hypothetical protein